MAIDRRLGSRLFAVIQLFDEHTDRFISEDKTRLFTNHRADIIRKDNGVFALSNYSGDLLEITIEVPFYMTEKLTLKRGGQIAPVRLTPEAPLLVSGRDKTRTLFVGKGTIGEYVRLCCPVKFCGIEIARISEFRPVFESGNFTHKESGRRLLVTDKNGSSEIVTAAVLPAGPPSFFTTAEPLKKVDVNNIVSVEPIFCARVNKRGEYVIRVENAAPNAEQTAFFLTEDAKRSGGRFIRSLKEPGIIICEGEI